MRRIEQQGAHAHARIGIASGGFAEGGWVGGEGQTAGGYLQVKRAVLTCTVAFNPIRVTEVTAMP